MPYILTKTNGSTLTTVDDATLNLTTNLTFVGRNYAGYGQVIDENFVKLLENFSNNSPPDRPIQGQLWFDSTPINKRLNLCYDGINFKGIANISVQSQIPSVSVTGDLWWDSDNGQLKAFDGSTYQVIGPVTGSSINASWIFSEEVSTNDPTLTLYPLIKGEIKNNPIVAIAGLMPTLSTNNQNAEALLPNISSDLNADFALGVVPGITLAGCDENGSSASAGYYFWGTAAESLTAKSVSNFNLSTTSVNDNFYIPFAAGLTGIQPIYSNSNFYYNPSTNVLNVTATAAQYADIAERYEADAEYGPGTVLVIGGNKEVTVTTIQCDTKVAGVVSTNPAYMLNKDAGPDATHPYIALKGRVPCKVVGAISKGDLLVTSLLAGHACRYNSATDDPMGVFARALEDFSGLNGPGVIEIKI
jgi:hypothetical protein